MQIISLVQMGAVLLNKIIGSLIMKFVFSSVENIKFRVKFIEKIIMAFHFKKCT